MTDTTTSPPSRRFAYLGLCALSALALCVVTALVLTKVLFRGLEFDEAEVLHASWLIANVGKIWVDVFEHHSPLYNTINAVIFDTQSTLFGLHAKVFSFATYALGTLFFSLAGMAWLNISRGSRALYVLITSTLYVALTWPVDIGVVRPENYAALSFMIACYSAFFINSPTKALSYAAGALTAFFAALAVSFSPRSIIMVFALASLLLWTLRARRDWLGLGASAIVGAAVAAACNLAIAPFSGFLLWIVQLNRNMRPIHHEYSAAADGAVVIMIVSLILSVAWVVYRLAPRLAGTHSMLRPFFDSAKFQRLICAQLLMIACWTYLLADPWWGRQSFGGIALAASVYGAVLVAHLFSFFERAENLAVITRKYERLSRRVRLLLLVSGLVCASVVGLLAADKIARMTGRLNFSGMMADVNAVLNEPPYRLLVPNDLLPLSETKSLAEWLLWSKRYCSMLRGDYGLASPHRHPVCMNDPTYYWYFGIHLRAMAQDRVDFQPSPPFDPAADILKKKPAFIDTAFLGVSIFPNAEVQALLDREYVMIEHPTIGKWAWLRRDFLERQKLEPAK